MTTLKNVLVILGMLGIVSSIAFADALIHIPPVGEQSYSSGRCITPDGAYVGGLCAGLPWPDDLAGFVWDDVNGARQPMVFGPPYDHSNPQWENGVPQLDVSGIGYRIPNDDSATELIIHGRLDDKSRWDQARRRRHAMNYSTDGGLTWSTGFMKDKWPGAKDGVYVPKSNSLASTGEFSYAVPYLPKDYQSKYPIVYIDRKAGGAGMGDHSCSVTVNMYKHVYDDYDGRFVEGEPRGVSATGLAIGGFREGRYEPEWQNMMWQFDEACPKWLPPIFFSALDPANYRGEPQDISDDGAIVVGMGPVDDGRIGKYPYMYDVASDVATELGVLPGMDLTNIAMGVDANGTVAVGYCSNAFQTKAVMWDLSDPGTAIDLTQHFTDLGLMEDWLFLYVAHAVAVKDSGLIVITGEGYTADANLHAFVAKICPDPVVLDMDILPDDDPNMFVPNKKGRGRLPIEIYGSETFDVADIDLSSIKIAGTVSPVKTQNETDFNGDGYLDLKIHIMRRDLIDALSLDAEIGNMVEVTFEAKNADLCDIIASDVLEIVPLD